MDHTLPRFYAFLIACILLCTASQASSQEKVSGTQPGDSGQASPDALRRRKATLERELEELRSLLADRKRELDEVKLLELEIPASTVDEVDLEPDIISGVTLDADSIFGGELRARARADIGEAHPSTGIRIDPDRFTTLAAKKMVLELRRSNSALIAVPKACTPDRPKGAISNSQLQAIVDDCKKAFADAVAAVKPSTSQGTSEVARIKASLEAEMQDIKGKIAATETSLLDIENQIGSGEDLTRGIVKYTIPSLGAILILIMLGPILYKREIQQEIFSSKLLLDLLTVYILVSTILILGLANRIQNEVLGTLLGGISGYVLGRSLARTRMDAPVSEAPR